MAFEEKRAWIAVLVSVAGYAAYLAIILGRAGGIALVEISYVPPLLWTVGGAIVATVVLLMAAAAAAPDGANEKDQRDREISRFGEYVGNSFVVIGAVAAMVMAMAELDHFWIANAVYLAFVLSAVLGSVARIVAYRRGLPTW